MQKKKKKILLIIGCCFFLIVILRAIGALEVNIYRSKFSITHSFNKSQSYSSDEKNFSYQVTVNHKGEEIFAHTHIHNNLPPIELEANFDTPTFQGNYFMPLIKNFRMTYFCNFKTIDSPNGHHVDGEIRGDVTANIQGLCSHRKAKDLAFAEAKKQIESYFQTRLNQ